MQTQKPISVSSPILDMTSFFSWLIHEGACTNVTSFWLFCNSSFRCVKEVYGWLERGTLFWIDFKSFEIPTQLEVDILNGIQTRISVFMKHQRNVVKTLTGRRTLEEKSLQLPLFSNRRPEASFCLSVWSDDETKLSNFLEPLSSMILVNPLFREKCTPSKTRIWESEWSESISIFHLKLYPQTALEPILKMSNGDVKMKSPEEENDNIDESLYSWVE